jgi:hypothetical protein
LPDPCVVEFEPRIVETIADDAGLKDVYAVLAERHITDEHNIAARHDEHQP